MTYRIFFLLQEEGDDADRLVIMFAESLNLDDDAREGLLAILRAIGEMTLYDARRFLAEYPVVAHSIRALFVNVFPSLFPEPPILPQLPEEQLFSRRLTEPSFLQPGGLLEHFGPDYVAPALEELPTQPASERAKPSSSDYRTAPTYTRTKKRGYDDPTPTELARAKRAHLDNGEEEFETPYEGAAESEDTISEQVEAIAHSARLLILARDISERFRDVYRASPDRQNVRRWVEYHLRLESTPMNDENEGSPLAVALHRSVEGFLELDEDAQTEVIALTVRVLNDPDFASRLRLHLN